MAKKIKQSVVSIPTTWLIAGALLLVTVVGAKAAYDKTVQKAAEINEVGLSSIKPQEGTFTGTVSREAANAKEKERYVITLENGAKYILIGLKKSYVDKNNYNKTNDEKEKGKPSAKPSPKTTPRADADDVNSFEQYVGKKVTIVGMVVPVEKEELKTQAVEQKDKADRPEKAEKAEKSNGKSEKRSQEPKPSLSPKPSPSGKVGGWDYDRLVVKSIIIVQ